MFCLFCHLFSLSLHSCARISLWMESPASVSPALAAALARKPKAGAKRVTYAISGESFMSGPLPLASDNSHSGVRPATQEEILDAVMSRLSPSTALCVVNDLANRQSRPVSSPLGAALDQQQMSSSSSPAVPKMRPAKPAKAAKTPANIAAIVSAAVAKALAPPKPKTKKTEAKTDKPKKKKQGKASKGASKGKTITIKLG